MPGKKDNAARKWTMFPSLHSDVARLLQEENLTYKFHHQDDENSAIREYDTNVMGRFVCYRKDKSRCSAWTSRKVPITIRLYPGDRYNARVYYQQCEICKKPEKPQLDHTYAERVAYRIKKWNGVEMDIPPYDNKRTKRPHRSDLCEGCKKGHCTEANVF